MQPGELAPHPEGGRFREVFRSALSLHLADGRTRAALTHIYFELQPGEFSGFHKVNSDEVWNLYRGDGVRLLQWDGASDHIETIELSAATENYCHIVPAGSWQAAAAIGSAVLVGCSVAPGFDFEDFAMLAQSDEAGRQLLEIAPQWSKFF